MGIALGRHGRFWNLRESEGLPGAEVFGVHGIGNMQDGMFPKANFPFFLDRSALGIIFDFDNRTQGRIGIGFDNPTDGTRV